MKYIKENWSAILISLFLVVVGILLLVNPSQFASIVLKLAGAVLILCGLWDLIKYFRADAEDAARGSGFFSGATLITAGAFCIFSVSWLETVFPVLAVVYGVMQILFGYRKLQRMVDHLRLKKPLWWTLAISAGLSILFGFIIALNPGMTVVGIWVFTGVSMIIEGLFDAAALILNARKKAAPAGATVQIPG